jgi:5-methylcytosine-specific restriction endonuclease McrA
MKSCSTCRREKPEAEFHRRRSSPDGLTNQCKSCSAAAKKAHYAENRDLMRSRARESRKRNPQGCQQRDKRYYETHRDAVLSKNVRWAEQNPSAALAARQRHKAWKGFGLTEHFTAAEWDDLCARFGNRCLRCGKAECTVDHIIPLSKGGPNTIDNIQPLCNPCNASKSDKVIDFRCQTTEQVSTQSSLVA